MTRKEALTDLLAKVEAGTLQYNDADIIVAVFDDIFNGRTLTVATIVEPDLNGMAALHEAVLPEYDAQIRLSGEAIVWHPEWAHDWPGLLPSGDCPGNPARAWLIAIIKALISQEEDI